MLNADHSQSLKLISNMLCHKVIGLAILSLVLSDVSASSGCKDNFTAVAGKCLFASRQYLNWYDAERYCRTLGAGLLSLQNASQLNPIENYVNDELMFIRDVWTSGNSLGHNGEYFWQSTGEQADYLPWSMDQPRTNDGDCLIFNDNHFNSWNEYKYRLNVGDCNAIKAFVCEQQCF